ncbi:MAG TPA: hypothetical protein VF603_12185 [Allosphingosinicella sp.]|jgi:hypothetical protein
MRSFFLHAGVALATLAGLPAGAPAQPRAPASAVAGPAASCRLPPGWSAVRFDGADDPRLGPVAVNDVAVLPGGEQRWNGQPINRQLFGQFLLVAGEMMPRAVLLLWPDGGAGCDDMAAAAAFVESRFLCSPEMCRIAGAGSARRLPPPAPPPPPSSPSAPKR